MSIVLKEFQDKALEKIISLLDSGKEQVVFQSATGSGKTIILCSLIDEYLSKPEAENIIFVWFTPGNGELEEQSQEKFTRFFPHLHSKSLTDALSSGFEPKDVVFINWEQVNKKDNKAIREAETLNLYERISQAEDKGYRFILIIDEAHLDKTKKTDDILAHFTKSQQLCVSATIDKTKHPEIDVEIDEADVIRSGLITKHIVINEGLLKLSEESNITDENHSLIDLAISKQREIKEEYKKLGKDINPLILIQYANESNKVTQAVQEQIEEIDRYLAEKYNFTYENKLTARWFSNDKKNITASNQPEDETVILHVKQAVATGWDCPRAKILVKFRLGIKESFEIQVLGRIRRMPELQHYDNPVLDNCFLFTFDTKYKQEAIETFGGKESRVLYLKDEHKNKDLGLKREERTDFMSATDTQKQADIIVEYFIEKYGVAKVQSKSDVETYKANHTKLEKIGKSDGYTYDENLTHKVFAGEVSTSKDITRQNLSSILIRERASHEKIARQYHQVVAVIAHNTRVTKEVIQAVVNRLFIFIKTKGKRNSYAQVLNFDKDVARVFIVNNREQFEKDIKEAKTVTNKKISESQWAFKDAVFSIPEKEIYYFDPEREDGAVVYDTNVYKEYASNIVRSTPEQRFEYYIDELAKTNHALKWIYKNGDKGNNYLSIGYVDNLDGPNLFYPDYIIGLEDEEGNEHLLIVEVKGGCNENGESRNIDSSARQKMYALKMYEKGYNHLKIAFVRDNEYKDPLGDIKHKLVYSDTEWKEDSQDASTWKDIQGLI